MIAGIGRSWVDEILWTARLSPFQRGSELDGGRHRAAALATEAGARRARSTHYEQVIGDTVPDKAPMPLQVHRRQGEACPRCGATLAAVHYKDYVMTYCPEEQAGGKL